MHILHQILAIRQIEPLRVTCLWNTGEVRLNDFTAHSKGENERLHGLADVAAFKTVKIADGAMQWPAIQVLSSFRGELTEQPLTLDPEVLYEESKPVGASLRAVMSFRLKQARLQAQLTQAQLAALSGTTKEYISKIESGKANFEISTFERILQEGLGKQLHLEVV